ncbi:MAG: DNA adenine methylase [Candidatus Methanomethylicaceae archaeon]
MKSYRPLFPYFGGKSKIAHIVWSLLGDVDHYVEPFFGSGAVLFLRPGWHRRGIETVNDNNVFIANFWRAIKDNPEGVARHANWPVNEADLTARHIWLVKYGLPLLRSKIFGDPDYYDAEIAGWWVWGISQWIGGGWCSGKGRWTEVNGELAVKHSDSSSVRKKIPHVAHSGHGVVSISRDDGCVSYEAEKVEPDDSGCQSVTSTINNGLNDELMVVRKRPHITRSGCGVISISRVNGNVAYVKNVRPHLSSDQGIISIAKDDSPDDLMATRRMPHIGRPIGVDSIGKRGESDERAYENILDAMRFFSDRLRHVRVVCGDWSRVVTRGSLSHGGTKGIFLDPPYSKELRSDDIYSTDDRDISKEVNEWCVENGGKEDYRIVLCGYEGEHNNLEDLGWKKLKWVASRAMGRTYIKDKSRNYKNRFMERIWYSPHCLPYHGGDGWNHPTLW